MDENERAVQVELAANGDADALQRLIVHYHTPLRVMLDARVDSTLARNIDPDDVLQEAYIAAFNSMAECTFDGPGGFYKWLETIARRKLSNQQRALRRQKRDIAREVAARASTMASCPDLVHRLASPDTTPSRQLAKQEAVAAVMSSLARLTDDQRNVVKMRFLEGRPVAEVVSALGKTTDAVNMLCHRGLKKLRKVLGSITHFLTDA